MPETVKSALTALQQDLKKCGADIKWVKLENIHLTLKFLGNIEEKDVGNIVKRIEGACAGHSFFDLEISSIGVFPDIRSPRVLWAGIQGNDILAGLHRDIDEGMALLGFKKEERRFSPHLTIGRFRSFKGKAALADKIERHRDDRLGLVNVKSVFFMKSDLGPAGAKHSRIAEIILDK